MKKSKMFWKCETLTWISLTQQFCFHFLIILLSWSFQFSSVEIKDHPASCNYLYWLFFAGRQKNRFPLINLTTPGLAPFTSRKELCVSSNCISNQKLQSKSRIGLAEIVQQEVDIPSIISNRKRGFTDRVQWSNPQLTLQTTRLLCWGGGGQLSCFLKPQGIMAFWS